jgi:hypothetical protein
MAQTPPKSTQERTANPNNVAWQALRATQQSGIPLNSALVDQTPMGSFWTRKNVYVGTGATALSIQLPRIPSAVITVDNNNGAVIYRTASDVAASGPSVLVCRATQGVSVSLLIG